MNEEPIEETVEIAEPTTEEKIFEALTLEHTLAEMWTNVLNGAGEESRKQLTMQQANGLTRQWPQLQMKDLIHYRDAYFRHLAACADLLKARVDADPEVLAHAEDDATWNRGLYLNIALDWNQYFDEKEEDWRTSMPNAAAELAGFVDAAQFLVSAQGLLGHLDQIGVEYTGSELSEARAARGMEEG
nr:MAG TPA_asm: hypothetical protein [Caudoviricetes sp.]